MFKCRTTGRYVPERHTKPLLFTHRKLAATMALACFATSCVSKPQPAKAPSQPEPSTEVSKPEPARLQPATNTAPPRPVIVSRPSFQTVDELMRTELDAGTEVQVRAVVTASACRPSTPGPCQFLIADRPFAPLNARAVILVPGDLASLSLPRLGDTAQFTVRVGPSGAAGEPARSRWLQLVEVNQAVTPNLADPREPEQPTYVDGSWSIADLLNRPDLLPSIRVTVTAYVVEVNLCPRCPKGAHCQPCSPDSVALSDSPDVIGATLQVAVSPTAAGHRTSNPPVRG